MLSKSHPRSTVKEVVPYRRGSRVLTRDAWKENTMAFADAVHDMREEVHDLMTIGHVDAARQAYVGLWASFVAVPFIFGVDKFAGFLGAHWQGYLAGWVNNILPGNAAS